MKIIEQGLWSPPQREYRKDGLRDGESRDQRRCPSCKGNCAPLLNPWNGKEAKCSLCGGGGIIPHCWKIQYTVSEVGQSKKVMDFQRLWPEDLELYNKKKRLGIL